MQTDYKDLECHCAEPGLNSVGDGEPWRGFNQASDVIPPVRGIGDCDCSKDCGRGRDWRPVGCRGACHHGLDFPKPGCLSQSGNHGMGWGKRRQKLGQNESVKI